MAKLSVSGKVVHEISHNIPGSKFAIIELIKNAYEAGANEILINVFQDKISIIDDGNGMNENDIDTLLTVSHSEKVFGQEINGRLVSGEKGLGFFSAFKFGNIINVATHQNGKCFEFELNMEKIENTKNLYNLEIPIKKGESNKIGTEISISDLNSEALDLFNDVLTDEAEYSKLLKVIDDPEFRIKIKKYGKNLTFAKSNPNLESAKLASATFDSTKKENDKYSIKLNRNDIETVIEIDEKYIPLFKTVGFSLEMAINLYRFGNQTGFYKNDVSKVYYYKEGDRIVPLVYVNNALFDNYTMYNTEINAPQGNLKVFRQQNGKIKIFLRKPGILNFNADRTQMNESIKQKLLKEFLDFFSSQIQIKLRDVLNNEEASAKDKSGADKEKEEKEQSNSNDSKEENQNNDGNSQTNKDKKTDDNQQGIKVDQLVKEFVVLRQYEFHEVFRFTDSQGGSRVKPATSLSIEPKDIVTLDNKNRVLTFTAPYNNVVLHVEIEDKITNKTQKITVPAKSIIPATSNKRNVETGFIKTLMFIEDNVADDIFQFKNEINALFKTREYTNILTAGIRTFIELVVSDIMDFIGENKSDSLNDNYQKIISKQIFESKFTNLTDDRDKKGITSLYTNLDEANQLKNLVNSLNLTTHNASRLIGIDEIKQKQRVINLIYTYLCFVSQQGSSERETYN